MEVRHGFRMKRGKRHRHGCVLGRCASGAPTVELAKNVVMGVRTPTPRTPGRALRRLAAREHPGSGVGAGTEQAQAEPPRQESRDELTLDAVPRGVEPWREGAQPALARRDGHDAASDTTLAG